MSYLGWPVNLTAHRRDGGLRFLTHESMDVHMNIEGVHDSGRAAGGIGTCLFREDLDTDGTTTLKIWVDDRRVHPHGFVLTYEGLIKPECAASIGVANGWRVGRARGLFDFSLSPCVKEIPFDRKPTPEEGYISDQGRIVWYGSAPKLDWQSCIGAAIDPLPAITPAMPVAA